MQVRQTGDGSCTLYSADYGEAMHSRWGAVSEARHVFLEGSGVRAQLAAGKPARILEVGFGTGLNFLLTLDAAAAVGGKVHYTALESTLPEAEVLFKLDYGRYLLQPRLWAQWLEARAALPRKPEFGLWRHEFDRCKLELFIGDATEQCPGGPFDAVYHDGYSPAVNPELWTAPFLARLARVIAPGGRLASFCVKGEVRRSLAAAGLVVSKQPGPPGGKREVLYAVRPQLAALPAPQRL